MNATHPSYRQTALHIAAMYGEKEIVALLLTHHADVHAQGYKDQSPLHVATCYKHPEVVKLLLGAGAQLNQKDSHGLTPAHYISTYLQQISSVEDLPSHAAYDETLLKEIAICRHFLEHKAALSQKNSDPFHPPIPGR